MFASRSAVRAAPAARPAMAAPRSALRRAAPRVVAAAAARPTPVVFARPLGLSSPLPVRGARSSSSSSPLRPCASAGSPPPPPPKSPSSGGSGDDSSPPPPPPSGRFVWKGWADRAAADPEFGYKVFIEQVIGVGAAVIGDMSGRPNWGLNELDFVFATLIVGSIVNFALMYLLAPTASAASLAGAGAAAAKQGLIARLLSEETLRSLGAPGGHMFEPGFGLGARLVNLAYKGVIFGTIGLLAGIVGTSISNGLLALRKRLDPSFEPSNEPPSVLGNATCWGIHMGLSSNIRYQILNGMDMVVQPVLPAGIFRILTSVVRGLNNVVGGISFVLVARGLGVQKSAESKDDKVKVE